MGLFDGKKGLILGVANDHSIAWAIAKVVMDEGGLCGFTHLPDRPDDERQRNRRRVALLTDACPSAKFLVPLDVAKDEQIKAVMDKAASEFGKIDFLLHAIAFASMEDLKRDTVETSRAGFLMAMEISAYSLLAVANHARAIMNDGGSIATMTYFGGEKAVPGYNVMGICKAALDSAVKYLAYDLGPRGIRVNALERWPAAHAGWSRRRRGRHAAVLREGGAAWAQRLARRSGAHRRLSAVGHVRRDHRRNPARRLRLQHHGHARPLAGRIQEDPMSAAEPLSPRVEIAIAVVERDGQFLIGLRPEGESLAGYWEFPGGKLDPGEQAADAARRECLEETGLEVRIVGDVPGHRLRLPARPRAAAFLRLRTAEQHRSLAHAVPLGRAGRTRRVLISARERGVAAGAAGRRVPAVGGSQRKAVEDSTAAPFRGESYLSASIYDAAAGPIRLPASGSRGSQLT